MSRNSTLILLGILIVLTPFSGFPIAFRTFLTVIFGATVSGIGLALRAHEAHVMRSRMKSPPAPSPVSPAPKPESPPTADTPPQEPHGVSPI